MDNVESFINDLQKEITRLKEELEQANKDIKDFEVLAVAWKKGYADMERDYKIKLANAQNTIEELEKEIKSSRSS